MKIGLIQNEAVVGDLSHNLRLVVQGYRQCLDEGAELVVASAQALDGAFPHDLAGRSSFRLQAAAALAALASETSCPLLLASYAGQPGEPVQAQPYLLCRGEVRRLCTGRAVRVCGQRLWMDVGEEPSPAPDTQERGYDALLHLPLAPWWQGQAEAWQSRMAEEASRLGADVLLLRGLGCTEGQLAPGGSMVFSPQGGRLSLPFFKKAAAVWRPGRAAQQADGRGELLLQALCYGLRSTLQQSGYEGVAVAAEGPRAALLLALARAAVGARHTVALCTQKGPLCALAGKSRRLSPAQAEAQGLLHLNPLNLNQLLLGDHAHPALLAGAFAPLGEVYDSELPPLQNSLRARLPEPLRKLLPPQAPEADGMEEMELRLLAEQNAAPAEILHHHPGCDETRLRSLLRRMAAASRYRHGRPELLHIRRKLVHLPMYHKHSE